MCDENDSGFELAYANVVTVDEKRSPQRRGSRTSRIETDLGRIWPRLGVAGGTRLGLGVAVLRVA